MTPFGERVRSLRDAKGVTLKQMATDLSISSAYLSALEHGKRGQPSPNSSARSAPISASSGMRRRRWSGWRICPTRA